MQLIVNVIDHRMPKIFQQQESIIVLSLLFVKGFCALWIIHCYGERMGSIERRLHYSMACRYLQNIYGRLDIFTESWNINWSKMFPETKLATEQLRWLEQGN